MNIISATLHDSQTGKRLGQISLVGEPIQADALISASGSLQSFSIVSDTTQLWEVWINQQAVLLRTAQTEQLAKIVTYPTEDEHQAYLEIIPKTGANHETEEHDHTKNPTRRGLTRSLAFVQALFGA